MQEYWFQTAAVCNSVRLQETDMIVYVRVYFKIPYQRLFKKCSQSPMIYNVIFWRGTQCSVLRAPKLHLTKAQYSFGEGTKIHLRGASYLVNWRGPKVQLKRSTLFSVEEGFNIQLKKPLCLIEEASMFIWRSSNFYFIEAFYVLLKNAQCSSEEAKCTIQENLIVYLKRASIFS